MLYEYDACEEQCPLPLLNMRLILKKMQCGDKFILKVIDQGSKSDIPRYLTNKGYQYTQHQLSSTLIEFRITTGKLL